MIFAGQKLSELNYAMAESPFLFLLANASKVLGDGEVACKSGHVAVNPTFERVNPANVQANLDVWPCAKCCLETTGHSKCVGSGDMSGQKRHHETHYRRDLGTSDERHILLLQLRKRRHIVSRITI